MQSYGQWHSAVFGATLFQASYRADASADAFGAQAFFDLESENDPSGRAAHHLPTAPNSSGRQATAWS